MRGNPGRVDPSLPTITVAGFAATIAQVLLLRELLVLFHGNEMSAGLALAGWLLWTSLGSALAARRASAGTPREGALALLLVALALALPALVLLLRGARGLLAIPAGELAPLGKMSSVCLGAPALFGVASGALFGLCWAYRRGGDRGEEPGAARAKTLLIYMGEAVGAAAGGVVFYFLLLGRATAFGTAVGVALLPLAVAGWILWRRPRKRCLPTATALWWIAAVGLVALLAAGGRVEQRSRRWQWGEELVLARDTPFHHIAVLEQPEQVTVFTNGLWLFTQPDPVSAEPAVHPALLAHAVPRRLLLLGGGVAGYAAEALKHPSVEAIDYVEQDPELIGLSAPWLMHEVRDSLEDRRLRVHHEDAVTFLRRHAGTYDVVLMNVGDPINAQMNRFFTVEMFRRIERRLAPGGILTFSVPGGGDMIGPAHARYLRSMHRTLGEVFPAVAVVPGERARFFAAREAGAIALDPWVLGGRIEARGLELAHVRRDTLEDLLSPFRLEYVRSLLGELGPGPANREFAPICYLHALGLWAARWHPGLEGALEAAAGVRPGYLAAALAALGALVIVFFRAGRPRYRAAVGASVLVQGGVGMVVQIVLILTFQILAGFAYLQLALIIALFMAGLAAGTLWVAVGERFGDASRAIRGFTGLQVGVTAYPLALLVFLSPVFLDLREALSPAAVSWLFAAASFAAGVLGGAHFSLAALASTAAGGRLERAGGVLYAADLAGAAGGALVAGLFLLPLYGVPTTLVLSSLASLVCLVAILRRPR